MKAKNHGEQNPEFSFSSPVHKVVFNPYSEPAPKLRQMFFNIFLSKLNFTLLFVRECGGKSFVYEKGGKSRIIRRKKKQALNVQTHDSVKSFVTSSTSHIIYVVVSISSYLFQRFTEQKSFTEKSLKTSVKNL